jgi:hypothetical protein
VKVNYKGFTLITMTRGQQHQEPKRKGRKRASTDFGQTKKGNEGKSQRKEKKTRLLMLDRKDYKGV